SITLPTSSAKLPSTQTKRRVNYYILAAAILAATALAYFSLRPLLPPRVLGVTQITNDRLQKSFFVSDGSRLYISELSNNRPTLVQVSAAGGNPVKMPLPFRDFWLDDISPNGSELFIGSFDGPYPYPCWLVPLPGGSPRRLGEVSAQEVHPSPDGQQIAYIVNRDLYLARADGTGSRKLVTVRGNPGMVSWPPDSTEIRFSLTDPKTRLTGPNCIWEVAADGSNLHPLLSGWNNAADECCGRWTPDGKYFVFVSYHGSPQPWAIREKADLLGRISHTPVQLTSGRPMSYYMPFPS